MEIDLRSIGTRQLGMTSKLLALGTVSACISDEGEMK
jgi:hypothetical protein